MYCRAKKPRAPRSHGQDAISVVPPLWPQPNVRAKVKSSHQQQPQTDVFAAGGAYELIIIGVPTKIMGKWQRNRRE